MIARKCLNCGEVNYSADTFSKYWICCRCGCQILKQEKTETDECKNKNQKQS